MKKLILSAVVALCAVSATAATATAAGKEVKTGWSLGLLPCATYSSDMGFQYGAFGDVYYHGDGSTYPDPLHKFSWEISHYTKGRSRFYLAYDSKYVIPNMRVTASATHVTDPLYSFYGFNGAMTEYNKESYGSGYYYMQRNMTRLLADFQGKITPALSWAGGINYWHFSIADLNKDKYTKYDPTNTIYDYYRKLNILSANEVNGGSRLEIKAGLVYDTRDIEAAPNRGIWSELYLCGSPDLFRDSYKYLKLSANWKQYLTVPLDLFSAGRPVFAYRLAYQGTIAGESPFYMQQNINALVLKQMISEGFGSSSTVRGTYMNRIIADGYAWGNFELRVKLVRFKLLNQFFYLATNPFFDCGFATKAYKVDELSKLPEIKAKAMSAGYKDTRKYINDKTHEFVKTAGLGLKLAWNENFIISAEFAHNFNLGLGDPFWMSIGVNYGF